MILCKLLKFNSSEMTKSLQRQVFFDKQVKMEAWKNSMSGVNEKKVIKLFDSIGYKIETDYVRQYAVGEKYVLDFAFLNEKIVIEADGNSHLPKKQKRLDKIRDRYLSSNGWITLRILDKELFGYKNSFYKNLIREIVEERREQYNTGKLYPIEFSRFNEEDYE